MADALDGGENVSTWAFSCKLGLAQESCGSYERDPASRGAKAGLGGCPSCTHRQPYNEETAKVEAI